jgi:hypothetical protein
VHVEHPGRHDKDVARVNDPVGRRVHRAALHQRQELQLRDVRCGPRGCASCVGFNLVKHSSAPQAQNQVRDSIIQNTMERQLYNVMPGSDMDSEMVFPPQIHMC